MAVKTPAGLVKAMAILDSFDWDKILKDFKEKRKISDEEYRIAQSIDAITIVDREYPIILRQMDKPPFLLCVHSGDRSVLSSKTLTTTYNTATHCVVLEDKNHHKLSLTAHNPLEQAQFTLLAGKITIDASRKPETWERMGVALALQAGLDVEVKLPDSIDEYAKRLIQDGADVI